MMRENIFFILLLVSFLGNTQNIKTVQLTPLNNKSYTPIVPLGGIIQLSFDDLDADNKEYQYKIQHMTYDWKPSNLISNQYINGFNSDYINDVTNSFNTLQDYTHYKLQIPNQNTTITKSGNYLISVFDDNDVTIFSRRFIIYEELTTVGVSVLRSRNVKTIDSEQTIHFLINHGNLSINNPFEEIKVILFQNNNWKTAIYNLKPQFIKTDQLIYNYIKETNFPGGNEFLNFDSKSIRNTNLNIARVIRKDLFHHYLYTNEIRKNKRYSYQPDINGEFVIRTLESEEDDTEADYTATHFSLNSSYLPFKDKDIYIYGNFNNYNLSEENKMTYNENKQLYETTINLKQGFYNYNFITLDKNNKINTTEINGSFYETENEYTVIVYYSAFGGIYDRVVGVGNGFFDQNR